MAHLRLNLPVKQHGQLRHCRFLDGVGEIPAQTTHQSLHLPRPSHLVRPRHLVRVTWSESRSVSLRPFVSPRPSYLFRPCHLVPPSHLVRITSSESPRPSHLVRVTSSESSLPPVSLRPRQPVGGPARWVRSGPRGVLRRPPAPHPRDAVKQRRCVAGPARSLCVGTLQGHQRPEFRVRMSAAGRSWLGSRQPTGPSRREPVTGHGSRAQPTGSRVTGHGPG